MFGFVANVLRKKQNNKRRYSVGKTEYRLFVALLYGSYPMSVMFSYGLIEG